MSRFEKFYHVEYCVSIAYTGTLILMRRVLSLPMNYNYVTSVDFKFLVSVYACMNTLALAIATCVAIRKNVTIIIVPCAWQNRI